MSKQLTSVRLPHPKGDPRMRKFVVLNLQWWKKLRSAERDWCAVCCRGMDQHNQIAFTSPFRVLCVFQPTHNGIRLSDDLYRSESYLDFGFLPNSMAIAIPLDWNCIWVAKCLKIVITTPIRWLRLSVSDIQLICECRDVACDEIFSDLISVTMIVAFVFHWQWAEKSILKFR